MLASYSRKSLDKLDTEKPTGSNTSLLFSATEGTLKESARNESSGLCGRGEMEQEEG